jgi:hypothetical protein
LIIRFGDIDDGTFLVCHFLRAELPKSACHERARDAAEVKSTAAILVGRQVAEVGQPAAA